MDERKAEYEFVPPLDTKYECPICRMVLVDPIQTQCGHRYCKACINKWLREKGGPKCPLCNDRIGPEQLFQDNFAKREISALTVRCARAKKGCKELVEFKYIDEHINNSCGYGVAVCPLGCKAAVLRRDLERHKSTDCPHRIVQCPSCNSQVKHISLTEHVRQCPGREVKCRHCSKKVRHEKISLHETTDCEEFPNMCFYNSFGCEFKANKARLKEHCKDAVAQHLELLTKHVMGKDGRVEGGVARITEGVGAIAMENSFSMQLMTTGGDSIGASVPNMTSHDTGITSGYESSTSEAATTYSTSGGATTVDQLRATSSGDRPNSYPFLASGRGRHPHAPADHPYSAPPQPASNEVVALRAEVTALKKDIHAREQKRRLADEAMAKMAKQITEFEPRHCGGRFLWKIPEFARKRRDALSGNPTVIHSPGFYSSFYGYKLCVRANLNGVETGTGKFISLFVHFMRGDYDDVLEWPFQGQITITVVDQNEACESRRHISETLVTKPHLAAFQKPVNNRNHKGFGYIEFAPIEEIVNSTYIKNDVLIIKAVVENKN